MFSGDLLPEYPCKYPSVWVGERSDSRVGNAALTKKGGIPTHPPLKRKTPNTENSQMISEIQLMFQVSGFSKERLHVDFFFCLVNLSPLGQIFVDVKIRHSSLILKEVLLIFTNKPQDGGEES